MAELHTELSLAAQTSYAELLDQSRLLDLDALGTLTGSFHRRTIKGHAYVYFGYRDPLDGAQRRVYVGPDDARVQALVARFNDTKAPRRLAPNAQAALALGCTGTLPKHYRIVRQLAAYGFFRAGGVLIGTHAFVAMANMLGLRWTAGDRALDIDVAHAGRNVSLALPSDMRLSVHDALTSLELGLLPIQGLGGQAGAYRNPRDPELRIDFLTPLSRDPQDVPVPALGISLEPLRFMEFSLEGTTQAALLSREGAVLVTIPAPSRYAVHKLIVHGERDTGSRAKAVKDLQQAAALAEWHLQEGQADAFNRAWRDACGRGRGWLQRAKEGRAAMLARYPPLADPRLWQR